MLGRHIGNATAAHIHLGPGPPWPRGHQAAGQQFEPAQRHSFPPMDNIPKSFQIGLVLGSSGSGKTRYLKEYFGNPSEVNWISGQAIVSQFPCPTTQKYNCKGAADEAIDRLSSVGLGSIPTWMRPFECLSNGEQARANLARIIRDGAIVDDFTALVNRHAAWAMSSSISRFIRSRSIRRVVFASSCSDIVQWLQPDWIVVLEGKQDGNVVLLNPNRETCGSRSPKIIMRSNDALTDRAFHAWSLKNMTGISVDNICKSTEPDDRLQTQVTLDESTERASEAFDYDFTGKTVFLVPKLPALPDRYSLGLVVGPSGSGKTSLLRTHFGYRGPTARPEDNQPIHAHFLGSQGAAKLRAVGLPDDALRRSWNCLSKGEQSRVELALNLVSGAVVDEFTSNTDRHVAKELALGVREYADKYSVEGLVLATCHDDFIPWLQPDWVFSTQTHELAVLKRSKCPDKPQTPDYKQVSFESPIIELVVQKCKGSGQWELFREYHYLDQSINKACSFFVSWWEGLPVACVAITGFPGAVRQGTAMREHRTVVLPDFQGLGVGTRVSNFVAASVFRDGKRFFSRTAHPRFGHHREKSDAWVGTSSNNTYIGLKGVYGSESRITGQFKDSRERQKLRLCYSHEYVGTEEDQAKFRSMVEPEVMDAFLTSLREGRKRDARQTGETQDQLKEKARSKLKAQASREGQSGKTEFSKGGIQGPNKLECLVAFGNLKPGVQALTLECKGKKYTGNLIVEKGSRGKIVFDQRTFGDTLSFTNAVMSKAGGKPLTCNSACWRVISQGGVSMQALRLQAAARAKAEGVNPRSIKEWQALGDGHLAKIRRLNLSPPVLQPSQEDPRASKGHGHATEACQLPPDCHSLTSARKMRKRKLEEEVSKDWPCHEEEVGTCAESVAEKKASHDVAEEVSDEELILKDFGGTLFVGVVVRCDEGAGEGEEALYRVVYEDGDEEDLDPRELCQARGLLAQQPRPITIARLRRLRAAAAAWHRRTTLCTRRRLAAGATGALDQGAGRLLARTRAVARRLGRAARLEARVRDEVGGQLGRGTKPEQRAAALDWLVRLVRLTPLGSKLLPACCPPTKSAEVGRLVDLLESRLPAVSVAPPGRPGGSSEAR